MNLPNFNLPFQTMSMSIGEQLRYMCQQQTFTTRWSLIDLAKPNELISYGGDQKMVAHSIRKISLLSMALDQDLDLTKKVLVSSSDQVHTKIDSGLFQHFLTPFIVTVNDLLVMMMSVSDTTELMIKLLGGIDQVNQYCHQLGLIDTTHLPNNDTSHMTPSFCISTTNDTAVLLQYLATNPTAVAYLSHQKLSTKFPRYLPEVKIAHKGGTGDNSYHDAGIFYRDNTPLFILVVFTDNATNKLAAYELIGRLAEACWNYYS